MYDLKATNLFMLAWPWISTVQIVMYRHYVHTCLIIIGSDDSCWSRHLQLNNGLRHINTFNLYITHTGLSFRNTCLHNRLSGSCRLINQIQVVSNSDNIVGSFYKPAVELNSHYKSGSSFLNDRGTFSVDLPSISPAQKS